VALASNRERREEETSLTSPGATTEQDYPRGAREPSASAGHELTGEQLRAKVDSLAEQVRRLPTRSQPTHAAVGNGDGHATQRPADAPEELARHSGRLLESVIETAELAAAEIRASAEREAARIRERASTAIGDADALLGRYRRALTALSAETERIERAVAAMREQALALEAEHLRIDAALDLLRRRPAP